jgi:DNA-binding transcriptional LysR family regulator
VELKQLQAFLSVAQLGSFTKAAEELFITQPTLSYRISSLESELGVPLFSRSGAGISLTEEGKTFFADIAPHMMAIDQAKFRLTSRTEMKSDDKTLIIAFPILTMQDDRLRTADIFEAFARLNPDKELRETRIDRKSIAESIQSGWADIAFITIRDYDRFEPPICFYPLARDEYVLLSEPGNRCTDAIELLKKYPLFLGEDTRQLQDYDNILKDLGISPEIRRVESTGGSLKCVERGEGVVFWPRDHYVRYLRARFSVVRILSPRRFLTFGAVWNNGNPKEALRRFLNCMRERAV